MREPRSTPDPQRSADVLQKVIGSNWSGSMTHDGFSSYDRFEDAAHQQCVDHALRRARGLVEKQAGAAKIFPQQVIDLLTEALRWRDRFDEEDADLDRRGRAHEDYVQRLIDLTARPRANEANARFICPLIFRQADFEVGQLEQAGRFSPPHRSRVADPRIRPAIPRRPSSNSQLGPSSNMATGDFRWIWRKPDSGMAGSFDIRE